MESNMEVIITGSGTSQGVPVIGCDCKVCKSHNPKDKRLRSSVHITYKNKSIVIDTGPDFRQQMINNNIMSLNAVLFTHEHKDHVAGLDDVRPFNFIQKSPIDIFCNQQVFKALKKEFHYIFDPKFQYPGIPKINRHEISNKKFFIEHNIEVIPIKVMHYKLPVLGFRIENFAYITDAKTIDNFEKKKLKNLDLLIVNALRVKEHLSHFNLEEAISLIKELKPKKAILTHISHYMGLHDDVQKTLPENITVGYDNQKIILN
jgi:phosphoribosyl 1,2-cyclic phosphate phosphodiesterase